MSDEITESAKAVQEVAKVASVGIQATTKLGGFLAKVTREPVEAVTGILTDRLRFMRWERQVRLVDRSREIMLERGIGQEFRPIPPKIALPIVENASIEDNDELQDLWANLLVSALDPNHPDSIRIAFIDILKQLEVVDANVLNRVYLRTIERSEKTEREWRSQNIESRNLKDDPIRFGISSRELIDGLGISNRVYENAIDNLVRVRCLAPYIEDYDIEGDISDNLPSIVHEYDWVSITPLGISFIQACISTAR
jgi:Abortive infection alpha